MNKVFIAGSEGTAGLRLRERLSKRADVQLLEIDPALRKDAAEIEKMVQMANFVFLCLPDEAACQVAEMAARAGVRVIDCSTAHRTARGWVYGFPEHSAAQAAAIARAQRVAAPGCHSGGLIALVYPLIAAGLLSRDALFSCTSLTGYSGGGKQMIAAYEAAERNPGLGSPQLYALGQNHKHLPEIQAICGLAHPPLFLPIVGDFYAGMLVTLPLHAAMLSEHLSLSELRAVFQRHYAEQTLIHVREEAPSTLFAGALAGQDDMEIFVTGNVERFLLSARFDNLGKGASGAALQCFNLMCGLPTETGLTLSST